MKALKLYYYWCPTKPELVGWFADMNKFRAHFQAQLTSKDIIIRVAHSGVAAPDGYRKTGGELALDPVERIPTMRDFIHAMTP